MRTPQLIKTLLASTAAALLSSAAHAFYVPPTPPPTVGLEARDLNKDGTTDAFYDTALNITWLRDANYAKTSSHDADGRMNWTTADTWANNLSFGGYSDWRLPTVMDTFQTGCQLANSGTFCGYNVQTGIDALTKRHISEMANLFYVSLGNKAFLNSSGGLQSNSGLTNKGDFQNFQPYHYWSGTEHDAVPGLSDAWYFDTNSGYQNYTDKGNEFFALAVRDGDVTAAQVPEPEMLVLVLTGLSALALVRRRRACKHRSTAQPIRTSPNPAA